MAYHLKKYVLFSVSILFIHVSEVNLDNWSIAPSCLDPLDTLVWSPKTNLDYVQLKDNQNH